MYDEGTHGFLVASRWPTPSALNEFLSWHEEQVHASLADITDGPPKVTHLPLAR